MIARRALVEIRAWPWLRRIHKVAISAPGVGGVLRHIVHRALPYGTRAWVQVRTGLGKGLWLRLDPRYELSYWDGGYEAAIQNFLATRLQGGDVFYDVGAHIGFFSLIASRLVGKGGSVLSFEADADNAERIAEHTRRNGLNQIQIFPLAVWSESCQRLRFQRASKFSSRNTGRVVPTAAQGCADLTEVETIALDALVQMARRPPTLLKVDVEGAEIEVMRGALTTLSLHEPTIVCEIHNPGDAQAFHELLASLGYEVWRVSDANQFPAHFVAETHRRPLR